MDENELLVGIEYDNPHLGSDTQAVDLEVDNEGNLIVLPPSFPESGHIFFDEVGDWVPRWIGPWND